MTNPPLAPPELAALGSVFGLALLVVFTVVSLIIIFLILVPLKNAIAKHLSGKREVNRVENQIYEAAARIITAIDRLGDRARLLRVAE
jgi:hypothetical protein